MVAVKDRANKIRVAVRYLLEQGALQDGDLTRLAEHFQCTRERVRQLKVEQAMAIRDERIMALRPRLPRRIEA